MAEKHKSDQYNQREAQRRFIAALKAAVNTPPKPLKDMQKRRYATKKKRAKA